MNDHSVSCFFFIPFSLCDKNRTRAALGQNDFFLRLTEVVQYLKNWNANLFASPAVLKFLLLRFSFLT